MVLNHRYAKHKPPTCQIAQKKTKALLIDVAFMTLKETVKKIFWKLYLLGKSKNVKERAR